MSSSRVPEPGDIVWIVFDDTAGTEQRGLRPAVVVSETAYNASTRRAIVCPVTTGNAPSDLAVRIPNGGKTTGAVLCDQVRSLDREARNFRFIERVPPETLADIRARLAALLGLGDTSTT